MNNHTKLGSKYLVALIGTLSQCKSEEDAILGGHPNTISQQDDLVEILLALFI